MGSFGLLVWFLLLWTYNWSYIYLAFVNSTLTFASYNYSYKSCTLTFLKNVFFGFVKAGFFLPAKKTYKSWARIFFHFLNSGTGIV